MDEQYVYVDSRHRDYSMYASNSSYTIYMWNPIKFITRVDLVCATIPPLASTTIPFAFLDIEQFRTKYGIQAAVSNITGTISTSNTFVPLQASPVFQNYFAFVTYASSGGGTLISSTTTETGNIITTGNTFAFGNVITTGNVITNSTNPVGATLGNAITSVGNTLTFGNTFSNASTNTFGNVNLTAITTYVTGTATSTLSTRYYEEYEYKTSVSFKQPIESLDRLNIRWVDNNNNPVVFNGEHSFVLRIYTVPWNIDSTDLSRPLTRPPPEPINFEHEDIRLYLIIIMLIIGVGIILLNKAPSV